jgi:hypothetical protein
LLILAIRRVGRMLKLMMTRINKKNEDGRDER